jgi:hypothetical protein
MEGDPMNNASKDEALARAERLDRERSRNLDNVRYNFIQHFRARFLLHDFWIIPQGDRAFRAYIFFEDEKNKTECECNGIDQEVIDFVYAELERQGRGKKGEITVAFEFDSHEHVQAKYDGNYFLRFRS